jgi:hypothetical protein
MVLCMYMDTCLRTRYPHGKPSLIPRRQRLHRAVYGAGVITASYLDMDEGASPHPDMPPFFVFVESLFLRSCKTATEDKAAAIS